jgi:hypothetical protein
VFVHELPDIDWIRAPGFGFTLDVTPDVRNEGELRGLLGKLAGLGWATAEAQRTIQQAQQNWHGLGAAAFADELPRWRPRAAGPDAHHSEEMCYLDHCDGGFYTLTATVSAHESRQTRDAALSFQLCGIPLDSAPQRPWMMPLGRPGGPCRRSNQRSRQTAACTYQKPAPRIGGMPASRRRSPLERLTS